MGLIDSALQVGRSALLSYQSALQVIGNNISNAGSADYTRQTPGLTPLVGAVTPEGMRPGAGVALTSLKRNLDEGLENRIRAAIGNNQSLDARRRTLGMVESLFDPLTGLQLQDKLTDFFNTLNEVQNAPADVATRGLTVASAASLAGTLREMRSRLTDLGNDLNEEIGALVTQADGLAERIAQLNTDIVAAESSGAPANPLRDQRDAVVRELSEIVEVSVRVHPDGSFNVYVGNENIVQGGVSRGLTRVSRLDGDFRRDGVAFADTNAQVALRGGRLEGLIKARDEDAFGRITDIDRLAAAIIFEVNKIHADGQGLVGFTTVVSSYAVADPTAALNSSDTGLPFTPTNGSFYLSVTDDNNGTTTSYQIEVDLDGIDDDTTLESLAADINATVAGVTASVTLDNRLSLAADSGLSFTFGHDGQSQRPDTSGLLAALGVNTLFKGSTAADIAVNETVESRPALFAAAAVNLSGDGANAGRLIAVSDAPSDLLEGASMVDFFGQVADAVAVRSASARDGADASTSVLGSLRAQKENISGVSLDEEAIELIKFERAFQGAARFVSVVDRLTNEMLALVR
ncbi:MAG: flagellar hook-associated protein FlgK [Mycobacterium sp.]